MSASFALWLHFQETPCVYAGFSLLPKPLIRLRHLLPVRGEKDHRILRCARSMAPRPACGERYSVESQAAFAFLFRERVASAQPGSTCSRLSPASLRPFG